MDGTAGEALAQGAKETRAARFIVLPVVVLILAQMGTSGDNATVALAAGELTAGLHASISDVQLANMVYSLVAGALMVAGGLMGTIIGWKKNFRIGALLCALGELLMAFSPTIDVFTWGGRLLVGLGASFLIPSVLGLVPRIYEGKNRVMAFGCIGAATGFSVFLPLVFGLVMQAAGFRVTFGVLGAYFLVVFAFSFALPPLARAEERLKFDVIGTILSALGLFLLLMGLSRISAWGLVQPSSDAPFTLFGISPCLPLIVLGAVVLAVMIKLEKGIEKRNGIALLPRSFIANSQVLAGLAASALTFLFMLSLMAVVLNPYLELVGGWSVMSVGAVTVFMGVPMIVFSLGIPRFMPQANPRRVLQVGYLVSIASVVPFYLSIQVGSVSLPALSLGFVLAGVGCGVLASHTNNVVALALNERDAAQSGGVQTTSRNVGQALGVALLGTVLLFGITSNINAAASRDDAVSPQVAAAVSERNVSLMSDEQFENMLSGIAMSEPEKAELVSINASARVDASHVTLAVAGVVLALGLLTTPFIKTLRKREEER